jgi:hypothetical protein
VDLIAEGIDRTVSIFHFFNVCTMADKMSRCALFAEEAKTSFCASPPARVDNVWFFSLLIFQIQNFIPLDTVLIIVLILLTS